MVRGPYFDKNGVKKGAWSSEEDDKLRSYIQRHGHWNWRELPMLAGLSRCGKSCRLRWMNYLRPNVKLRNYSKEEDDMIIKLHKQFGNKWSKIAAKLPGRTDNEIKNHWHSHLKKQNSSTSLSDLQLQSTKRSTQVSESEVRQISRKLDAESSFANINPYPILENTPFSPETSSSELSYTSSISTFVTPSTASWVPESEAFQVSSGDFWTEPFIADNAFNPLHYPAPSLEGLMLSEDNIDLFYPVLMQESPQYTPGF